MDTIADFFAALGTSALLIVLVASHILEEALKGFRRFFNLDWFRTGRDDFPTSKTKAILVDQIGLFLALSLLILAGAAWTPLMYVVVGFITADVVQHVSFSVFRSKYTPGVATSVLYLSFVIWFVRTSPDPFGAASLVAAAIGAAALVGNYLLAWVKVRRWRQETVGA
jgi:uncharacterized protein with HXXEE motif